MKHIKNCKKHKNGSRTIADRIKFGFDGFKLNK